MRYLMELVELLGARPREIQDLLSGELQNIERLRIMIQSKSLTISTVIKNLLAVS